MDNIDYSLHIISFLFTIIIILLSIIRGLSNEELILNILYFTTLNLTFLKYLFDSKEGD